MSSGLYTPDDLARAVLHRVVPGGYRLVDEGDERFAGFRSRCIRMALRHLGPRPNIVAFCAPADAEIVARAAAEWAATNFKPNAIQKKVRPGVLVVAIGDEATAPVAVGLLPGTPVPAAIWWASTGGGVQTSGSVPGGPSAGVLKQAVARLAAGAEAPTIGHIDVAERALMYGRGGRSYTATGTGLTLLGLLAAFAAFGSARGLVFDLQAHSPTLLSQAVGLAGWLAVVALCFDIGGARSRLPGFSSSNRPTVLASWAGLVIGFIALSYAVGPGGLAPLGRRTPGTDTFAFCSPPSCVVLNSDISGRTADIAVGSRLKVYFPAPGGGRSACPNPGGALTLEGCAPATDPEGNAYDVGQYQAVSPGSALLATGGGADALTLNVQVR